MRVTRFAFPPPFRCLAACVVFVGVLPGQAFRRALVVGSLRPEDPLPSVRDLAAQLVVNPRTVSQAYGELERQGIVYVRRGQGTFVSPDAQPDRKERRALAREVARRALREAWRNGVGMEELVKSIREVAQAAG